MAMYGFLRMDGDKDHGFSLWRIWPQRISPQILASLTFMSACEDEKNRIGKSSANGFDG